MRETSYEVRMCILAHLLEVHSPRLGDPVGLASNEGGEEGSHDDSGGKQIGSMVFFMSVNLSL